MVSIGMAYNNNKNNTNNKMWIAGMVVIIIGLGGTARTGRTNGMELEMGTASSSSMCVGTCVPMCMKLDGARTADCEAGCGLGCEQLKGKGCNYAVPGDLDQQEYQYNNNNNNDGI